MTYYINIIINIYGIILYLILKFIKILFQYYLLLGYI